MDKQPSESVCTFVHVYICIDHVNTLVRTSMMSFGVKSCVYIITAGGLDYGPFPLAVVSITHTLAATSTQSQFGIQIREDLIVEETEFFFVELMLPSVSQPGVVIGTINRATVFIEDNDGKLSSCTLMHCY